MLFFVFFLGWEEGRGSWRCSITGFTQHRKLCRGLPRRSGTLTDVDAASKRERHFKELTLNIHSLVLDALSFSSPHQNSLYGSLFLFGFFKEVQLFLHWKVLTFAVMCFFFLLLLPQDNKKSKRKLKKKKCPPRRRRHNTVSFI